MLDADLCSVALGTWREGCIGETLAALEAAEALQHCEDPATRAVLERIAREEARHAELAWRFVAWALQVGPKSPGQHLRRALDESRAPARADSAVIVASDRALARHGLLSAPVRHALRERVLSEVIAPCAKALLGRVAA